MHTAYGITDRLSLQKAPPASGLLRAHDGFKGQSRSVVSWEGRTKCTMNICNSRLDLWTICVTRRRCNPGPSFALAERWANPAACGSQLTTHNLEPNGCSVARICTYISRLAAEPRPCERCFSDTKVCRTKFSNSSNKMPKPHAFLGYIELPSLIA